MNESKLSCSPYQEQRGKQQIIEKKERKFLLCHQVNCQQAGKQSPCSQMSGSIFLGLKISVINVLIQVSCLR